ncbi:uncharacterized protein LOC117579612 [Drosophila guanche]|uniref:uncharacterized protein LOC117579612 n=1 Tax=Drosophila guanche TaxID=7266 RepID=UPI001471B243|nr:uncharacterized protein LOC117579612 [Drosophila guanche]
MLSNLPIEILDKIYGCLSLKDKLQLAQVNEILGQAFSYHSKLFCTHLDCYVFTNDILRVFLPLCGASVVHMKTTENTFEKPIVELILKHCTNLKSTSSEIPTDHLKEFKAFIGIKSLRKIEYFNKFRCNHIIECINTDCKELKVFHIRNGQAQHIRRLKNLEKLYLIWPERKNLLNIFEIASHLKKLRSLVVMYNSVSLCQKLDFLLPELEELELVHCRISLSVMPTCPKLKSLKFASTETLNIVQIVSKYANTLERLYLYSISYLPKDLLEIISKCKKLQLIHTKLSVINTVFSDSLNSFDNILRENGFNEQRRLVWEVNERNSEDGMRLLMQKYTQSQMRKLIEVNVTDKIRRTRVTNLRAAYPLERSILKYVNG